MRKGEGMSEFSPPLGAPSGTAKGYKKQQLWWGWMNMEWLIHKILKDFVPQSGFGSRRDASTFQCLMVYRDLPKGWILILWTCERRNSACLNSPVSSPWAALIPPVCASCLFVWHCFCNGRPDICEGKALDRSHSPTFFWDWVELWQGIATVTKQSEQRWQMVRDGIGQLRVQTD